VFFRATEPPPTDRGYRDVLTGRQYLLKVGVDVPRPGSHILRHLAVQRLVDGNFDL